VLIGAEADFEKKITDKPLHPGRGIPHFYFLNLNHSEPFLALNESDVICVARMSAIVLNA
ncbi:hypothetical protein M8368_22180, partial [Enterobacter kobei]|nr:hypothetical protein [Enterobacter kobei]